MISPTGWVIEDIEVDQVGTVMATYDKSIQMMNTYTDIADVGKAEPEDFGNDDDD